MTALRRGAVLVEMRLQRSCKVHVDDSGAGEERRTGCGFVLRLQRGPTTMLDLVTASEFSLFINNNYLNSCYRRKSSIVTWTRCTDQDHVLVPRTSALNGQLHAHAASPVWPARPCFSSQSLPGTRQGNRAPPTLQGNRNTKPLSSATTCGIVTWTPCLMCLSE